MKGVPPSTDDGWCSLPNLVSLATRTSTRSWIRPVAATRPWALPHSTRQGSPFSLHIRPSAHSLGIHSWLYEYEYSQENCEIIYLSTVPYGYSYSYHSYRAIVR
eukprot:scaffold197317_cov39-Prasinocladus_malaysianus.AAC.1